MSNGMGNSLGNSLQSHNAMMQQQQANPKKSGVQQTGMS